MAFIKSTPNAGVNRGMQYIYWSDHFYYSFTLFRRFLYTNAMTLSTGVYRIVQWGQPQVLTVENGLVTVLPPGRAPQRGQEVSLLIDKLVVRH